ncbi:T9SS type A sorting domain-containing protein [Bacteroidota bacterium]
MKTNFFLKSLITVVFVLIIIISGINKLSSQIIYTDLTPDSVYTGWDVYVLKFDTSLSTDDGEFYIWKHPTNVQINSYNQNCFVITDLVGYPMALNAADSIGPSSGNWTTTQSAYLNLNDNGSAGNWINVTDKFLGLKYKNGNNWYYGWVRLDIDAAPNQLVIKDYAYQSTANLAIVAGNSVNTSIHNQVVKQMNFKVFADGKILYINASLNNVNSNVFIMNSIGQCILSFKQTETLKSISLASYPSGIYYIAIDSNQTRRIYKVFVN